MAKKVKKSSRGCVVCKWWPKAVKIMGAHQAYFFVNSLSGEVMVATGMRLLPDGQLVDISEEEIGWADVECDCGNRGVARVDLLEQGVIDRCPVCSAQCAQAERN